jgi:hypothetical protein
LSVEEEDRWKCSDASGSLSADIGAATHEGDAGSPSGGRSSAHGLAGSAGSWSNGKLQIDDANHADRKKSDSGGVRGEAFRRPQRRSSGEVDLTRSASGRKLQQAYSDAPADTEASREGRGSDSG